jgi:3-oxoacyl-[acyl-carrier protein] reductase
MVDLGIKGRVAIVTGGSRGLGRQAALSLAGEGVNVVICARGDDRLKETVEELRALGGEADGVVADCSVAEDRERLFSSAVGRFGQVDILVNNVGGGGGGAGSGVTDTGEDELMPGFRINLFGAEHLIRLAVPGMRERHWGRIIAIASIYGREHGGTLSYMSSKAALIAATKHHALELASDNVLCNTVAPGSILFPGGGWERFTESQPKAVVDGFIAANLPMGRFGWPEPVGDVVTFLASERASLITGACINVDGGQSKSLI